MNWNLWRVQTAAVLRLELKKSFFSRRGWWVWLLALGPMAITGIHSVDEVFLRSGNHSRHDLAEDMMIYAGIFQFFYLRLGIFFGCVGIFSNLFRGEMLEKTLHYYFLTAVRREVVVAGKYLAGVIASTAFFTGSAILTFLLIAAHFGQNFQSYVLQGPGLGHLLWYAGIAALACMGYGAVFLSAGMIFRNPMIPAAIIMTWEGMNAFLPPLLKKFSVLFYLQSLAPVQPPLPNEPIALLMVAADPAPAWLAIPGLLLVSAALLAFAGRKSRGMEISYVE